MANLNIQGLARRDKGIRGIPGLCSYIVPSKGNVFVSLDQQAGEPTVTAHYSKDKRYMYATLTGAGKEPFWDTEGILMIDDIYLMFMSATSEGKVTMRALWQQSFPDGDFLTQWMKDPKVIKKKIEDDRQYYKMVALALLYGLGPGKLQKQSYEAFNREITLEQAKAIYQAYWLTFKDVKALATRLQAKAHRGWFINEFGYCLNFDTSKETDSTHKACNYLIQSSVSGLLHVFINLLRESCKAMNLPFIFVTVIHDELVLECPEDRVDDLKRAKNDAVDRLNKVLKWSVPIGIGFSVGRNFYEAK